MKSFLTRAVLRRQVFWLILILCMTCSAVFAEIEKVYVPGGKRISFYWWPKLPAIAGWHQDKEYSFHYGCNALAPDGFTFANADTVIYAKADYKPRVPEFPSPAIYISEDKKRFSNLDTSITITNTGLLATGDGKMLRSFTFTPQGKGNWEKVSYGEEGSFYLIFTISSRSAAGYKKAIGVYEQLIWNYREKPVLDQEKSKPN